MTPNPRGKRVTIVSATHDYRSPRRAGVHGLADALVRLGCAVRFVSVRYSVLSLLSDDPRASLWKRANRFQTVNGVSCLLWRAPFHPVARMGSALGEPLHKLYAELPSRVLDRALGDADFVIVESGLALAFVPRMRRLNRNAAIIYRCSDLLETIGAHPYLHQVLRECAPIFAHATAPARVMAAALPLPPERVFFTPQGIDHAQFDADNAPNPYDAPLNGVSVGSMLFDASFFADAAAAFPDVIFHVIGAGMRFAAPANVRHYEEMPFAATLPFLLHATFGIAPYRTAPGVEYLAESSLKLTQFAHLGLPAVCPHFAAGGLPHRLGYSPGDAPEIAAAIRGALALAGTLTPTPAPTWEDVALRTLYPEAFADTPIARTREVAA
jgi:2-beta-glucuronyltransferase